MPAGTSLVCSSCRAPLRPGDVTCANCGAPVTGVGTPAPGEPPVSYPEGFAFSWEAVEERLAEITIGEYRILTELGRGGMAAVFLAHEYALNRKVALKVMSPAIMLTEGMVERFRAEAVMQANLTHPNIVGVHAVRQDEELQYFVMQYVPGRSLQQVLRGELAAGRMLSLGVIRSLVQQIGSALAYAHRRGVIHRDIKPGNVLLNADGDAVVTDFGIAKVTSSPTQTLTGMVVGTVPYMSPEQCYGAELTGASDQYSLGILTYELLTGATPFSGNSFMVMQAHTLEPPPPIIPRRPDCPPEFEAAVMKMLAKRHEDRFPDINAALVALEARPAPSSISDPLRTELITLADVASVEATFSGVLQVPFSPAPPSRAVRRPSMRGPRVADDVAAGGGAPEQQGDGSPVMALRLQDPPSRIEAGQRIRLGVAAFDANGTSLPDVTMRWSSSNPGIARVAADTGEIEALHPGSADIVVSAGHAVATARLVVAEAAIANIMGTNVPVAIEMGDAVTLAAEALDARGTPLARAVTWSLRKGSPAEISADGRLTALDEGIATLVATAGSVSAEFQVTIRPPAAAGIEVSDLPGVIAPGEHLRASVTLLDRRGRILRGRTVSWHSSAANVLAVSVDGEVTGVAPGEADIEVRCDDASHSAHVAVGLVTIASIDVGSLPSHLRAGSRRRLSAVATDSSGRERSTIPAQWSSSNPEVLAVDETGTAVAMAPGTASLSVRCGSLERAFPVHVAPPVSLPALLKRAWSVVPTRAALGIIGALAVVAVAVRFVPGWLHSRPAGAVTTAGTPVPPETTGQPIPASPATGDASLRFPSTLPRDAIVLVNGARVADAGQPVSLPPGRATIDITAAGFQPYHGEVTLEAGAELRWPGALVRAAADVRPGRVRFTALPAKAAVTVNDSLVDVVDNAVALRPGPARVVVSAPGFEPYERDIVVPSGGEVSVAVRLVAAPAPAATAAPGMAPAAPPSAAPAGGRIVLRGSPPPGATMHVNGSNVAVTDSLSLPPGTYRIQVSAWGYAELDSIVRIRSGEAVALDGALHPLDLARFARRDIERLRQAVEQHDLGEYRMVLDPGLLARLDSVAKAPGALRVIADSTDIRVDAAGRTASFVLLATLDGKPILPPRNYVASFRQLNSIWFMTALRNK